MSERNHSWRRRFLAAAFVLSFSGALWAQTKDTAVRGTVTDATGAVVPAVTVTLTSQGGAVLEAQTNERGEYIFRHLPAGTYTVEISVKGFQPFRKAEVDVASGQAAVVDAKLVVAMEKQKLT